MTRRARKRGDRVQVRSIPSPDHWKQGSRKGERSKKETREENAAVDSDVTGGVGVQWELRVMTHEAMNVPRVKDPTKGLG